TSNEILFDSSKVILAQHDDGTPGCSVDARIGKTSPAEKDFLVAVHDAEPPMKQIIAGVIGLGNKNPLSDGTQFTCDFSIAGDGRVTIAEVQAASNAFLNAAACLMVTPRATATPTTVPATPTATPSNTPIAPSATATPTITPTTPASGACDADGLGKCCNGVV